MWRRLVNWAFISPLKTITNLFRPLEIKEEEDDLGLFQLFEEIEYFVKGNDPLDSII